VGQGLSPSRRALFAAFASDGMDGPSGTGGAIVDEHFAGRAGATALEGALRRFSTGPLHQAAGTALPGIPTGHNLADIHVLLRC
jgi:hydroxypyruvate reductase